MLHILPPERKGVPIPRNLVKHDQEQDGPLLHVGPNESTDAIFILLMPVGLETPSTRPT